jgi:hypothetical protein
MSNDVEVARLIKVPVLKLLTEWEIVNIVNVNKDFIKDL